MSRIGIQQAIDTISGAIAGVAEQKFYTVNIPEFIYIDYRGGFVSEITKYREYLTGGSAFEGYGPAVFTKGTSKKPQSETMYDMIRTPNYKWDRQATWNIQDVEDALANSQAIDVIAGKMRSLKRNWTEVLQTVAFVGSPDGRQAGLLTQPEVVNGTSMTGKISAMSGADLYAFVKRVIEEYQSNCNYTEYPDTFVVPTSDWNSDIPAVIAPSGATVTYTQEVKLLFEQLRAIFAQKTNNPNFRILPTVFADKVPGLNGSRYALYKKDDEELKFFVPQDFTQEQVTATSGTTFECSTRGRIAGVLNSRPQETLYFNVAA